MDYTASLPRKRMAAAVLFRDPADRVLLVEPTYKPTWELPGGTVEEAESPLTAATRETFEELGLTVRPGRLLTVDWVPAVEGRTEGLMLVYDGGVLPTATTITLPADELRSWQWSTPADVERLMVGRLARRTLAALTAATTSTTAYLEDGHRVL